MLILLIKYFRYQFLKKFLSLEFFIESLTRNKKIIPIFIRECVHRFLYEYWKMKYIVRLYTFFLYIQSNSYLMNYNIVFWISNIKVIYLI